MGKRKRQKDKQCNGQKKKTKEQKMQWAKEKDTRISNDLQQLSQKTED